MSSDKRQHIGVPLAAIVAALAVGCPPHEDVTPQIRVVPGAAARMAWIGQTHVQVASAPVPPATVKVLVSGEELGGPNAVGRPGDLLLGNGEVVFVIDRLGPGAGFAESGGNLVDAADARVKKDELGQMFTYFGTFPRQAIYDKLTSGTTPEGVAWVEASGRELYDDEIRVTTRYRLAPGDRALLLETKLENLGNGEKRGLGLGDAIQWGGAEKLAPGYPVGFKGPFHGPYVGGVGRSVAYGITSTEGSIEGVSGASWTDTLVKKDVVIPAGGSVQYARVFVVGTRPDTASVVAELTRAAGGPVGRLRVVLGGGQAAEKAPAGARVRLYVGDKPALTLATLDEAPALVGDVPPGAYEVEYASGGGRRSAGRVHVVVPKDGEATVRLPVTQGGRLAFVCRELTFGAGAPASGGASTAPPPDAASPCKATFEGLAGTPDPDFGPAHAAGPARNVVTTATGEVDVPLAPGRYRVSLSRGPEYALASWEQDVAAGAATTLSSTQVPKLVRVIDTRGYLAADFHQHTMLGADAPVGTRDRVVANAAEGVEVAVASEHNVVADLEPVVKELGLARALVEIPGDELTTDTSKKPWGHANVYPLPYDANAARGGAVRVRDRSAHEVFDELRATRAPFVLQINHPRSGLTGYFDQLHFDAAKGEGTEPGYDAGFDALEVWNGRNVDARDKVLEDFLALLRTKHPVTATADTDTHGVVGQEAGYPRTFVKVDDDGALDAWTPARTLDLVRGVRERRDVVLTNGPFLGVRVQGKGIGGVARGRDVRVEVHVECAQWVDVDTLRLVRAVGPAAPPVPVKLHDAPGAFGAGTRRVADVVVNLHASTDDAFYVAVSGTQPLRPVLAGDAQETAPFAATGAVWIDADGDGSSLGRIAPKPVR